MKQRVIIGAGAALAVYLATGAGTLPRAAADPAAPVAPAPVAPATPASDAAYLPPAPPPPTYIALPAGEAAEVNGDPIMLADVNRLAEQIRSMNAPLASDDAAVKKAMDSLRGRALDNLIITRLLDQEASRLKLIPNDADIDATIAQIKAKYHLDDQQFLDSLKKQNVTLEFVRKDLATHLQAEAVTHQWVSDIAVSDDEVQKFYDDPEHQKVMQMPATVRARHILLLVDEKDTKEKQEKIRAHAEGVLKLALKGEDFGQLARQYSEDKGSKEAGGELGFFGPNDRVPEFSQAAFGNPPGVINHLVQTSYGYHIIKVEEKQAAHTAPFESVKDDIKNYLKQQKDAVRYSQRLSALRQTADVKIDIKLKDDSSAPADSKTP